MSRDAPGTSTIDMKRGVIFKSVPVWQMCVVWVFASVCEE